MAAARMKDWSLSVAIAASAFVTPVLTTHAQTPAAVVQALFDARDSLGWSRMVSLSHPEALKRFHAEQVQSARREDDMRTFGALPAVFRDHKPFYQRLYKVQSAQQLDAMPAEVMLAHYLSNVDRPFIEGAPGDKPLRVPPPRIVGTVIEGDSLAYVVFVWPAGPNESDSLAIGPVGGATQVMTLKRDAGQWKVMLDGGIVWGRGALIAFSGDD